MKLLPVSGAIGITLDGGDVVAQVGHRDEQPGGIVTKLVKDISRERVHGSKMPAGRVKDIKLAAVFRGDVRKPRIPDH